MGATKTESENVSEERVQAKKLKRVYTYRGADKSLARPGRK